MKFSLVQRAMAVAGLLISYAACRPQATAGDEPQQVNGRVVLVLPFDNRTEQKSLDWIGESFPETLNQALPNAGFLPLTYDDRTYALNHLGLPIDFRPSRATTFRLAQTLDADVVVIGSYTLDGQRLTATARLLQVKAETMGAPLTEQAELSQLLDAEGVLAWQVAHAIDAHQGITQSEFAAQVKKPRLDAYENFNRGLIESDRNERTRHLKEALRLAPAYTPASLALGKAYFAAQQWELAAAVLARVPKSDPLGQEAAFYFGLASFYSGKYPTAENAFAGIAEQLPLPEVVNNEGVAASRHGKDGAALFEQAVTLDPEDEDYHYNHAVALFRDHAVANALQEAQRALALKPHDTEAAALVHLVKGEGGRAASPGGEEKAAPLERIKRTYDEASFRQAAFALAQVEAAHGKGAR